MVVLVTTHRRLDQALSAVVVATLVVASVNCLQVVTGSYTSNYFGFAYAESRPRHLGGCGSADLTHPNFFAQALAVGVVVSIVRLIERGASNSAASRRWPPR